MSTGAGVNQAGLIIKAKKKKYREREIAFSNKKLRKRH